MKYAVLGWMLSLFVGTAVADDAVVRGESIYQRCIGCHSLDRDRTGPRHCGLLGRPAGSVEGFPYSPAMATAGIVWDRPSLDAFLRTPLRTIPGTSMGYAGIPDPDERADLIAYLAWASDSAPQCRQPLHEERS